MPDIIPINRDTVEARLVDLANSVSELDQLAALDEPTFLADPHRIALASFYLQRALEDVLGIGTHLLARLASPVTVEEYRHVLPELAKVGILPIEFAQRNAKLGSYRNRLVHHYLDITGEELYRLIHDHRSDLITFGRFIREMLEHPAQFQLSVS